MFCTVLLLYFLEQAAKMPSFRNPVPAIDACKHPLPCSAAASSSDQSLNIHGSSSTFNVYNYYSSSGRGSIAPAMSKVTSSFLRPAQSIDSPFQMIGRLSRPAKAHSSSSSAPQLSTPLAVAETEDDTESDS